jgi:hypothetical protein
MYYCIRPETCEKTSTSSAETGFCSNVMETMVILHLHFFCSQPSATYIQVKQMLCHFEPIYRGVILNLQTAGSSKPCHTCYCFLKLETVRS